MRNFVKKLEQQGYRCPADSPIAVQGWLLGNSRVLQRVPALLLLGPAGTGKTFYAECLAGAYNMELLLYQCHYGTGKEELLYDLDVRGVVEKLSGNQEVAAEYLRPGILPQAIRRANESDGAILLLDEIDKTRPEVDAFLLDFIQGGRLYDPHLGKFQVRGKLFLIATSNQERLLSEALMRRFRRVYLDYPPIEVELEILKRKVGSHFNEAFLKGLIKVANWLRKREEIIKPPSTPELVNLLQDLLILEDPVTRAQATVGWLCAYEEDRNILFGKYPLSWWEGMLKDEDIFKEKR